MFRKTLFLLSVINLCVDARPEVDPTYENGLNSDGTMHSYIYRHSVRIDAPKYNQEENAAEYWNQQATSTLKEQLKKKPNTGIAKNVILFLGDGMSIPTIAAARAYLGQKDGKPGEETVLSFEKFPNVGLSKTYCVDRQVADSACSSTAYLGGVKANEGTAGVTASVTLKNCQAMQNASNHVHSIGRWSQLYGKRTGVVTTTRITHASPSGVYAHTADRDWEADTNVKADGLNPEECHDIAHQLVHGETGKELNVIFGGGRWAFLPNTQNDEDGKPGYRSDKRNLIEEWKTLKGTASHQYVSDRDGLLKLTNDTDYVLGLFANDHIDYNLDRQIDKQPSLTEMTLAAIKLLSKGNKGYFLFVEGGRIDHAHHETKPRKSLEETVEFHKAIEAAARATNSNDTLIVVTSDHAHTMSLNGYAVRGNDILGLAGLADDSLPYATLSYANGPSYKPEENGKRHDISKDNLADKDYRYPSLAPLQDETHGGEDVGIFARGPWSHLYNGVLEQNVIPHIMAYASCVNVDNEDNACRKSLGLKLNPSFISTASSLLLLIKQAYTML